MSAQSPESMTLAHLAHATAVIGALAQPEELIAQLYVSPHDTLTLDATAANGIQEVRQFAGQLLLSPQFGSTRLGIIYHAEQLTPQAQNALLKLLEEPPREVKIILFMTTSATVLSTVLSRCRCLYVRDLPSGTTSYPEYSSDQLTQFLQSEDLAKNDQVSSVVLQWLTYAYESWRQAGYPLSGVKNVDHFWECYQGLETQINKRLLLEKLVISS